MTKRTILSAILLILLSVQGFHYLIDCFDYIVGIETSLYDAINTIWVVISGGWAIYLLKQFNDEYYWKFKLNWPNVGYVIVGFMLMHVIVLFSNIFFPMTVNDQGIIDAYSQPSDWHRLFLPIYLLIGAPICEEVIHRGVVMTLGNQCTKGKLGVLLSSITFSLLHLPYYDMRLTDFISYFAFGLVLGWVYKKSNSIYWSIVAHITWNSFVFLVTRG